MFLFVKMNRRILLFTLRMATVFFMSRDFSSSRRAVIMLTIFLLIIV